MREQDIDDLFAQAKAQALPASSALMSRILADASLHQPRPAPTLPQRPAALKSGWWPQLVLALGGRGVLAGLGTAAAAGVMLGFIQPASITAFTDSIFTQTPLDQVDLFPGIDAILIEG